jgi:uncharacterized protein (DUF362 family)
VRTENFARALRHEPPAKRLQDFKKLHVGRISSRFTVCRSQGNGMSRAYIAKTGGEGITPEDVLGAFEWLEWERIIPANARVFIKPNLTWPEHIPGVTTTPKAIYSVVSVLRDRTRRITLGESDGGYHSFRAEEAFSGHGLQDMAQQLGFQLVNLSRLPAETREVEVAGRSMRVTLPRFLLCEVDVFITLPVPKTHVMTGVSLALKNQWGCIPSTMRLREHAHFDRKIVAINRLLHPHLAVFDGTYFLDGAGPMTGDAIKMDLLIAGDTPGAASIVACKVMGIKPDSIAHHRMARREGLFPTSLGEVEINAPPDSFRWRKFKMRRAFLDWISLAGFHNRILGRIFWELPSAGLLHAFLYAVRRNAWVGRMLYGKAGPPPDPNPRGGV